MPQHDFDIANQSGSEFRADSSLALKALASVSSGASAPSTTYAYQLWADTTNGLLKQRNATNSAWMVRGSLTESPALTRSSNTVLGVSNYAVTIEATGTYTQTLTAASTLANGWFVRYRNGGTGIITLDPSGAETIDGKATIGLYPGEGCVISCDGSTFSTYGRSMGNVYIGAAVAASSAWITLALPSEFSEFEFVGRSLLPATNNVNLLMQYSIDGGTAWVAGTAYTYVGAQNLTNAPDHAARVDTGVASIELANAVSNSAFGGGVEVIGTIATGGLHPVFAGSGWLVNGDLAWSRRHTYGNAYNIGGTPNAVRLLMSSGNIASGSLRLWGKRK